jgi:hypothetical protein
MGSLAEEAGAAAALLEKMFMGLQCMVVNSRTWTSYPPAVLPFYTPTSIGACWTFGIY